VNYVKRLAAVLLVGAGLLMNCPRVGVAQAPTCTGNACADVTTTRIGTGMQFENQGKKAVSVSVAIAVGLPNGCSDPIVYQLAPGEKHLFKGHVCSPYQAVYK
jgi:hypothetical protein